MPVQIIFLKKSGKLHLKTICLQNRKNKPGKILNETNTIVCGTVDVTSKTD